MLRTGLLAAGAMTLWAIPASTSAQSLQVGVDCSSSNRTSSGLVANCNNNGTWRSPGAPGTSSLNPGTTQTTSLLVSGPASLMGVASARSDYGLNGVSAGVSLNSNDPNIWNMSGSAYTMWEDRLIINAPGLVTGTAVRVRMTQLIDITAAPFAAALSGSDAQAVITNTFYANGFRAGACSEAIAGSNPVFGGSWCSDPAYGTTLVAGRNVITYDFDLLANLANLVQSSLWTQVSVRFGYTQPSGGGSASVDALNTAHTYFTVLTPGATIEALSGHDYALPAANGVPEPDVWAMLIVGFGAVGGALRRRNVSPVTIRTA